MICANWFGYARAVAAAALVFAALPAFSAMAQTSPTPAASAGALQQQYDAAFAAMLADPANLDKTFRFAEMAVAVGDIEGAVSALERMLLVDANLPRVRLELGVLYYKLGSFEAARTYLLAALAAQDLPPDVRGRAETFLAEIEKQRSPSRFSGTVLAGLRYQSNANAAPTGSVRVGGIPADLDDNATADDDWNAFVAASVLHLFDMGSQWGDVWETRASAYVSRQFQRHEVDVSVVAVHTGPRFSLFPRHADGLTFRPSVAIDYVMLDDRTEYLAGGASAALEQRIGLGSVSATVDYRQRRYHDSRDKPFNSLRDGDEVGGRLGFEFVLTDWLSGSALAGYTDYDARASFESYGEWQVGGTLAVSFDFSPFVPQQKSVLILAAAYLDSRYKRPDPTVDPGKKRHDRDLRLSATATMPLSERISAVIQGGYSERNSSLPNYDYDNWSGMMGLAWRF